MTKTAVHKAVHKYVMTCDGCKNKLCNPNTGEFWFATTEQMYAQARYKLWTYHYGKDYCPICRSKLDRPGVAPQAHEFCTTECWDCSDLTCIHNTRRKEYYKPIEK